MFITEVAGKEHSAQFWIKIATEKGYHERAFYLFLLTWNRFIIHVHIKSYYLVWIKFLLKHQILPTVFKGHGVHLSMSEGCQANFSYPSPLLDIVSSNGHTFFNPWVFLWKKKIDLKPQYVRKNPTQICVNATRELNTLLRKICVAKI